MFPPFSAETRALGIKPYSAETETAFLETLNHALSNILVTGKRYTVQREVAIPQVLGGNRQECELFHTGRFDFVVYERQGAGKELPVLAIDLDGKEHLEDEEIRERERQKNQICRNYNFERIRVDNSYARRYNYMKEILIDYFRKL